MRQEWSADSYAENARFVSDLAGDVLAWLDAQPGERILDLGCGDGVLAAHLAARERRFWASIRARTCCGQRAGVGATYCK